VSEKSAPGKIGDVSLTRHDANNFDFLRFLAASLVVFTHSYALVGKTGNEPFFKVTGFLLSHYAVAAFFVISGFLVTQSFERSSRVTDFVWSRFLRIWPGLCGAVLFAILCIGPLNTAMSISDYFKNSGTWDYLQNLYLHLVFFLPGVFETNPFKGAVNGSLWTIPIEVGMYLVTMLVGLLGMTRNRRAMGALFVVLFVLYMHVQTNQALGDTAIPIRGFACLRVTIPLVLYYMAGALMYRCRDQVLLSPYLALIAIMLFFGTTHTSFHPSCAILAVTYLVIWAAFARNSFLANFGRFGDMSYGIYVYAFPIQQTVVHIFHSHLSPIHLFFLSYPVTCFLAFASWHLIESRCLKLKHVFRRNLANSTH